MAVVVSDTSPLRALAQLSKLDLLRTMFTEVFVPPGVIGELRSPRRNFASLDLGSLPYVKVQAPTDRALIGELEQQLDAGESQAIALAIELNAHMLLIDEATGPREAKRRGIPVTGVLGILRDAKLAGHISTVRRLIDELITGQGFFVSDALRSRILADCGEVP